MINKMVLLALAALVGTWIISAVGIYIYNRHTTDKISIIIDRELKPGASRDAMESFMRKYTARYGVDNDINFEYAGIMQQGNIDKILLDRKIRIVLEFDQVTSRYTRYNIEILYTFL